VIDVEGWYNAVNMRVINSVEFGGVEYQAIWASLSWIDESLEKNASMALAVRTNEGVNEAIIARNAKLAEVEASLRALREIGLGDPQLSQLFNYKGKPQGLSQHVKMLVSSLR
jgi:hypothetical protein